MQQVRLATFHLFFKMVTKCSCPLPAYILFSLLELWELLAAVLHLEYHAFGESIPSYLNGFFNFSETYIVSLYQLI